MINEDKKIEYNISLAKAAFRGGKKWLNIKLIQRSI